MTVLDIKNAIQRAMSITESANMNIRQHFQPVYTQFSIGTIRDCKLSKLEYALVLLNANPKLSIVGKWQLNILQRFFD